MKKIITVVSVLLFSSSLFAQDFSLEAGFRSQSGTAGASQTAMSQTGFQVGATTVFPISGAWNLRTGFLYTQHPLVIKADGTTDEAKTSINSLDLPVTAFYKLNDAGGFFVGTVVGLNLDSSYSGTGTLSGGKIQGIKSPATPIQFGVSFKYAPEKGVTLYYENQAGEYATGLSDYKAVGANFTFSLE